jgi:hypothetical protein
LHLRMQRQASRRCPQIYRWNCSVFARFDPDFEIACKGARRAFHVRQPSRFVLPQFIRFAYDFTPRLAAYDIARACRIISEWPNR